VRAGTSRVGPAGGLRVCLASIHPRALSGQIEALVGLAAELGRRGHRVRVVSAFPEAELLGGDRLRLADGDRGALLPKVARIRRILGRLAEAAQDADLLHVNLPTPAFSLLADYLRARIDCPLVVGYEAHLAPTAELLRRRRLLGAPAFYLPRLLINNRLVARMTVHRADRYVVSSWLQADELVATGTPAERIEVVPNAIDLAKLRRRPRSEARRALGLPDGRLVVYVGHYHHIKGADVLAEAFGRVAQAVKDARLVLAWSGLGASAPVERALARGGAADRVVRLGRVDVGLLLSAADVVALPYRMTIGQAAFPGLVLEAMAVGAPLVTTDLPLLAEMVADGRTALLCRPDDPAALAERIVRLLDDRRLAASMGAAQAAAMAQRFAPARIAAEHERIYEDVIHAAAEQARVLQPSDGRGVVRLPALREPERRLGEPARADDRAPAAAGRRKSA
jgi:glycosyltransferase involved in cell wall biosynthesis